MKTPNDYKKIIRIVFVFIGFMMLIPAFFMLLFDGIGLYMLIPIFSFLLFGIIFFTMFRFIMSKQQDIYSMHIGNQARHCVQCHEPIESYHNFCPHCGAEQSDYVICEYCGHRNNKHDLQCKECNALIK